MNQVKIHYWPALLLAPAVLALACNVLGNLDESTPTLADAGTLPAAVSPSPTYSSVPWQTYASPAGGFSIEFPPGYVLYVEQKPSVDGVVVALPNGIAILSPASPNFVLSVEYFPTKLSLSLGDYVLGDGCVQDPNSGQATQIDSVPGLLFLDTPCGPYGSSLLYVVRQSMGYRFTVESHSAYPEIAGSVADLLATIQWIEAEPVAATPSGDAALAWDRSRVGEAELVTTTQGWALIGGQLLWTTDGGETWLDITPPGAGESSYRDVFLLDANLGWAALADAPEDAQPSLPIQILHTQDGGTTWTSSEFGTVLSLGAIGAPGNLEFVDPEHGWLSVSQTLTMNSSAADLYRTTDGGLTWESSSLPFDGDTHFITPSIGWIVGSCCTGAPNQLYRTTDGGVTWQKQEVAPDPVQNEFDYNDYALPAFIDERSGGLAVTIRDESYNPTGVALHRTDNSGATWELAATLPTPPGPYLPGPGGSPGGSVPAQFLAPDTWFVAMNDVLYRSLDGGATWEGFAQRGLPGFHDVLEFVNADVGWSVVFKNNCGSDCLLLFETLDGGQSWAPVLFGE